MNTSQLYAKACLTWGMPAQLVMLMEECAELQQACSKLYRRGIRARKVRLVEELADVEIMMAQVKLALDLSERVKKIKRLKLKRLERRVKSK